MRRLLLLLILTTAVFAQSAEKDIRKVLDAQTAAWNNGDLKSFMSGYWDSPNLTFFSNTAETDGWQPTLDRYRQRYQSEGKEMGKLDFPSMKITMLGNDYALVRGHWHLAFKDGEQANGPTTLILQRRPEGWRIIHDHSSGE